MKKLMITVLAVFLFAGNGSAQQKGEVEFGVQLGVNFATISQGKNGRAASRTGISTAVAADCYFSDQWSIKAKLIYDQKGGDAINVSVIGFPGYVIVTDFSLDYITIPVMASWHFGERRNWYIHLGPYAGFLIHAKESRFGNSIEEDFASADWGIAFGLGFKIPVSDRVKLFFEYDGQGGIADIAKAAYNEGKNSRVALNFGIVIRLK